MEAHWDVLEFDFVDFEWDNEKAENNWYKHGLDFEDAKYVFERPVLAKSQFEGGEERWQVVGIANGREIAVVFTEREHICRIISAWRADRKTRARYYEILGG